MCNTLPKLGIGLKTVIRGKKLIQNFPRKIMKSLRKTTNKKKRDLTLKSVLIIVNFKALKKISVIMNYLNYVNIP
jgi:hypothetical protein